MKELVQKLIKEHSLTINEYAELLNSITDEDKNILKEEAVKLRKKYYGNKTKNRIC